MLEKETPGPRPLYARTRPHFIFPWEEALTKAVQQWMKSTGRRDANAWELTVNLYTSFRDWAASQNVATGGPVRFCKVARRFLIAQRTKKARGFRGFKLREGGSG